MRTLPMFVVITVTAFALVSLMFFPMARMTRSNAAARDVRRVNTALYFPSGASTRAGLPPVDAGDRKIDPFTYAVHAFKNLLLKNTGFDAISGDLPFLLAVFSAVTMTAATALFKRTL